MKKCEGGQAAEGPSGRKLERFEDLLVWQRAHQLTLVVYRMSARFPREEQFGLVPQMRRAAVSVPANIAEGFKKRSHPDKVKFYNSPRGPWRSCATT